MNLLRWLLLLFVGLKLAGVIGWPWLVVMSPLAIDFVLWAFEQWQIKHRSSR